jgi:hypothetical protein
MINSQVMVLSEYDAGLKRCAQGSAATGSSPLDFKSMAYQDVHVLSLFFVGYPPQNGPKNHLHERIQP